MKNLNTDIFCENQPLSQLFSKDFLKLPFAATKLICFFLIVLFFILHGFISKLLYKNKWKHRAYMSKQCTIYSKWVLKLFSMKVYVRGDLNSFYFSVSNHLSYLDILVLSSIYNTAYVTSIEMKNTPILGWITDSAGCLYVERRNRNNIESEKTDILQAMKEKICVTIFPEATSTNGSHVLNFKKSLFDCALKQNTTIQPICINYVSINEVPVNIENRDTLFWYGDMGFLPHLWSVLKSRNIKVQVDLLDQISVHQNSSIQTLAETSHSAISKNYHSIQSTNVP